MTQKRGIDVGLQIYMRRESGGTVRAAFRAVVYIRVAGGVEKIMPDKSGNIALRDLTFFPFRKQKTALKQEKQKFPGVGRVRGRADVIFIDNIRRKIIKENIRSLKPEAKRGMVFHKLPSELGSAKSVAGFNTE